MKPSPLMMPFSVRPWLPKYSLSRITATSSRGSVVSASLKRSNASGDSRRATTVWKELPRW